MVVLDVAEDQVDALVAELEAARPPGRAVDVPARHDGLHRHRVLQARDRRDQGSAAPWLIDELERPAAGLRRAAHHQRQRLPELLRPHPGRRHRPQGPARRRRRRRPGRGLPGPPRRRARPGRRASAARSAASRSPPTSCPTTSSGCCGGSTRSAPTASPSPQWVPRAEEDGPVVSEPPVARAWRPSTARTAATRTCPRERLEEHRRGLGLPRLHPRVLAERSCGHEAST